MDLVLQVVYRLDEVWNETTMNEGKSVTSDQTSHIRVTDSDGEVEITSVYAVTEEVSRELDRRTQKPTGKKLQAWLEKNGCQIDSSDGPALVWHLADGSMGETYYRHGKIHREDGPAVINRGADGTRFEAYWRNDERHREGGPALVWHSADGRIEEEYYRDGKRHRDDGPAIVKRGAEGTREERYYRDGEPQHEEASA